MVKTWDEFKEGYARMAHLTAITRMEHLERKFESPIERVMYIVLQEEFDWAIHQGKAKLECQKNIGKYRADFYLEYESDLGELLKFVIECDGHDYHERTKEQARHDKQRDRFMTQIGYIVLRYTGSEIFRDYRKLTEPIYSIIVKKDGVV